MARAPSPAKTFHIRLDSTGNPKMTGMAGAISARYF